MKPASEWNLTRRQEEIADLWAEVGLGKLIADRLHISKRTVEAHTESIKRKADSIQLIPVVAAWACFKADCNRLGVK